VIDCSVLLILVELLTIMVQIRRFYWLGIYNLKIQYSSVGPNVNWFYYFIEFFFDRYKEKQYSKDETTGI
jgi:hypothetical protein